MWIFGFKRLTVQQNFVSNNLVPVVLKVDTAILCINHYPVDSAVLLLVFLILIHWIEIYLMDSTIQHLNNKLLLIY